MFLVHSALSIVPSDGIAFQCCHHGKYNNNECQRYTDCPEYALLLFGVANIRGVHAKEGCDKRKGKENDCDDCEDDNGNCLVFVLEIDELYGLQSMSALILE